MQIRLPQADGSLKAHTPKACPITAPAQPAPWNRSIYAAAHLVLDPFANPDPWDVAPVPDWDATLAFRSHLYALGFKVAEAMDTAQRGMGLDWPGARELIRRSTRHARAVGGELACGVGTDQLAAGVAHTLAQVEAAYREQLAVVEAEGARTILMASRALAGAARGAHDYHALYGRILRDCSQPVILHWLGPMFDPALTGYWGSADPATALDTVASLIADNAAKVEGIKVSLLDPRWELDLRRRLPPGVKMYTGDDFNYAELIAGDAAEGGNESGASGRGAQTCPIKAQSAVAAQATASICNAEGARFCATSGRDGFVPTLPGHSHGLLGIFDPIAPVAARALAELAAGRSQQFHALLDPTLALSREIFRAPTRHYKAGVVFLAWLNGHQRHFSMAAGLQSARGPVHYARVYELADACGVLTDPELAATRMRQFLAVHCGVEA